MEPPKTPEGERAKLRLDLADAREALETVQGLLVAKAGELAEARREGQRYNRMRKNLRQTVITLLDALDHRTDVDNAIATAELILEDTADGD